MMNKCKKCKSKNILMVEYYDLGLPENVIYDGISEIRCKDCKTRFGRWSERELEDNEMERRLGGEPVRV